MIIDRILIIDPPQPYIQLIVGSGVFSGSGVTALGFYRQSLLYVLLVKIQFEGTDRTAMQYTVGVGVPRGHGWDTVT